MTNKILIVEDSDDLAKLIAIHMSDLQLDTEICHNGTDALAKIKANAFDLVILDVMLPGMDGLEVCKQARQASIYTPIVMLTSRDSEIDRVLGLEIGADDYLTKPFSVRELQARVKAHLRRNQTFAAAPTQNDTPQQLVFDTLTIDIPRHTIELDNRSIELTAKEFDLLLHLAQHPGQVFSRSQLLDAVWGYSHDGYEHTVNSHINRLRNKIEADPANPRFVQTVWGVGYKFNPTML